MRAEIFRQHSSTVFSTDVTPEDMYMEFPCADCLGSGTYEVHGDEWVCRVCKGSGKEWVNLY